MPFFKPSKIRRAIAKLKELKLIDVCRHSRFTWYQSNWFTINEESLKPLLLSICQNEQVDNSSLDLSSCSNRADDIKEDFPKNFTTQQQAAANLSKTVEEIELTEPINCGVVLKDMESEEDDLKDVESEEDDLKDIDFDSDFCHEGHSSAAAEPSVENITPTHEEVQNVLGELKLLPGFKLNLDIQRAVIKFWANVPNAIAYLKEALETWKEVKSPEAVLVKGLQEGRKPLRSQADRSISEWFKWAYSQRLVIAMSGGVCYTPDDQVVSIEQMMAQFPVPSS